jgi:hypothetical protein
MKRIPKTEHDVQSPMEIEEEEICQVRLFTVENGIWPAAEHVSIPLHLQTR